MMRYIIAVKPDKREEVTSISKVLENRDGVEVVNSTGRAAVVESSDQVINKIRETLGDFLNIEEQIDHA